MSYDYQELIENLKDEDVFQLLESLGAEPIDKTEYILCKTICHNIDTENASRKLYYYKNSHQFYCYTECGAMSFFKFLKHYYDTRDYSYDWYEDIWKVISNCSTSSGLTLASGKTGYKSIRNEYELKKNRKELQTYPKGILDILLIIIQ